ncbi:ATP synthase gamma chain [Nitrospira japonica]|uniref:ATP synthase gamma chain n=1 Tax=Nitrospira japonica TaxID=1325564 RepID=A0A1W1I7Q1_9BACT|nr:ATP synthase F1 subunit gamma [Nitrospira japonica]SLM49030.1 ATP synthase gamma chain [Nitrospira japonica]
MPSLQSVRRKIDSVKKTQKITKAMKMVAAAKLKRTQERILAARPYALKMRDAIRTLSRRVNRDAHPLLKKREGHRIEVAVVTSDRGLCGAFNANILRTAAAALKEFESAGAKVQVIVIGRKGRDFFRRRGWTVRREIVDVFDKLSFEHGMLLGNELQALENYSANRIDAVYAIYNEFKSAIQQRVVVERLLPLDWVVEISDLKEADRGTEQVPGGYLYEPSEDELLEQLLHRNFHIQAYRMLLESSAAEQGARMAAMDGATRNAGELIKKLTVYYNKTRQAAITKELMDIVGGAEALK